MTVNDLRATLVLLTLLGMALLASGCASRVALNDDLEVLLKDLEKKSYLVSQFKAEFHKVRKSPIFNREMMVQGVLLFQKENKFHLTLSGDVNVEILSDGQFLTVVHNGVDEEFYHLKGESDRSKFSDPLMTIVNVITGGDMGKFANVTKTRSDNIMSLEIQPGAAPEFERIKNVLVDFSESGTIKKVVINFKNGAQDTTIFDSWSMLTQDDPSIISMNARLEQVAQQIPHGILPGSTRLEGHKKEEAEGATDTVYRKPAHYNPKNGVESRPQLSIE